MQNFDGLIFGLIPIEILIGIPALLIATFVPIAILMIGKEDKIFPWDNAVILKKVISAKAVFIGIVLFIFVTFAWGLPLIRILLLIVFSLFVGIFLKMINELYKWLVVTEEESRYQENYRSAKRKEYLKSLDDTQKRIIWSLTWKMDKQKRGVIDERTLIKIFIQNIQNMESPDAFMLRNFIENLDKIDIFDPIIHEDLVNFCLENASYLARVDSETSDLNRLDFGDTVPDLYFRILKNDLENDFGSYLFFAHTRKFIKEHNFNEGVLVNNMAARFLNYIEDNENLHKIFENFPADWRITYEGIENQKTQQVILNWLNAYMHWVIDRNILVYDAGNANYDSIADTLTQELLPKIDPFIWTDLIAFHWSSFGQNRDETQERARIRNFIEGRKRFGLIGRVHGFWEDSNKTFEERDKEERRKEIEETFNIATKTTIFPILLNQTALDNYLNEIDKYGEENEAKKEKLKRLKILFEEIKNRLNSK